MHDSLVSAFFEPHQVHVVSKNAGKFQMAMLFSYSSPASETQLMWNMSDFLCNPQHDQQSTGETSIAVSPNTPLLCTYKTCKQPVYHMR